eukprot:GGOE01041336.1.p1 GENE.GGOE01041336.1~~GGOE01041336.1.p1  ORF type:complete len:855 (-),score=111.01 GGOE01041336.1:108-2531(-)
MDAAFRPASPVWPAPMRGAIGMPTPGLQELATALLQSLLLLQTQAPTPGLSPEQYTRLLEAVQRHPLAKDAPAPNTGAAASTAHQTPPKFRRRDGDDEVDLRQPAAVRPSVAAYDSASEESYDWHAIKSAAARRLAGRSGGPPGEGERGPKNGPPPRWSRSGSLRPEATERTILGGGFMTPSTASPRPPPQRTSKPDTPKHMRFEEMFPPKRKRPLTREVPHSDTGVEGSHLPPSEGQSPTAAFIAQRFQARRQQLQEWHEKADAEWNRLRNQRLGSDPAWKDSESTSETNKRPETPPRSDPPPPVDEAAAEDGTAIPLRAVRKARRPSPTPSKLTPNPKFFASSEPVDSRNVIIIRSFDRVADPPHRRESSESTTPALNSTEPADLGPDGPLRVTVRTGSLASTSSLSRFVATFGTPKGEADTFPSPALPPSDPSDSEESGDHPNVPQPDTAETSPLGGSLAAGIGQGSDSGDSPRRPSLGHGPRPRARSPSPASRSSFTDRINTLRHALSLPDGAPPPQRQPCVGSTATERSALVAMPRFVRVGDLDLTSGVFDEEATNTCTDPTAGDALSDAPATPEEDPPQPAMAAAKATTPASTVVAGPTTPAVPDRPLNAVPPRPARLAHSKPATVSAHSDSDDEPWSNPVSEEVLHSVEQRVKQLRRTPHGSHPTASNLNVVMEGRAALHRGRAGHRNGPADTCSSLSLSDVSDSELPTLSLSVSGRGVTPMKPTLLWPFDSDDDGSLDSPVKTPPAKGTNRVVSPSHRSEAPSPMVTTPTTLSQLLMEKARVQANLELTQNLLDCLDAL